MYGKVSELIPTDAPTPYGKYLMITHYVDANLMHCLLKGRSVTGILTFLKKTPIDWFSKKQSTVETVTYSSDFVAAHIAIEPLMDLRLTLRYLEVSISERYYIFGDNKSVVDSSNIPHEKLLKLHHALSYHRVR